MQIFVRIRKKTKFLSERLYRRVKFSRLRFGEKFVFFWMKKLMQINKKRKKEGCLAIFIVLYTLRIFTRKCTRFYIYRRSPIDMCLSQKQPFRTLAFLYIYFQLCFRVISVENFLKPTCVNVGVITQTHLFTYLLLIIF